MRTQPDNVTSSRFGSVDHFRSEGTTVHNMRCDEGIETKLPCSNATSMLDIELICRALCLRVRHAEMRTACIRSSRSASARHGKLLKD